MPHIPASENLILGCAFNYSNQDILPFLNSLQACGYTDDLILLTNNQSDIHLQDYFFNGTTINVDKDFAKDRDFDQPTNQRFLNQAMTQLQQGESLAREVVSFFYHHYFLMTARYFFYHHYLLQWKYSQVFLTDVNDVFFQRDPFKKQYADGVTAFAEYEGTTLQEEVTNHYWIKETFGDEVLEQMGNEVVYCAGTILLKNYAIPFLKDFLSIVIQHKVSPVIQGVDQAVFNYLISYLKRDYFHHKQNSDVVLTVANVPEDLIDISEKGMTLKGSHQLPDIVHQYTRFIKQKEFAVQRFQNL